MLKNVLGLVALCCSIIANAQVSKTMQVERIDQAPKIDGILDDEVWKSLPVYNDFHMYQPGNEGTIDPSYQTEVQMAYDDRAVYVSAFMKHPDPSVIPTQFSQRDEVGVQADVFAVALNTYNDGINETRFYVTSAGTIGDSKVSQNNQDFGYDVVFECRISFDEAGWYAEYRIPYNALRFPEVEVQNWSVNFYRQLTNENETHTWNFIKNGVGRETQYNGKIEGVQNINPPTRLTLFPFAQGVATSFDGTTNTNFSAGMDIKYGISDSFTLDATLIPDFGQAAFDRVELNLGPFEQTFSENRQFFTEGVELFNKGRIFFSRRVGNAPTGRVSDLAENETISEFPERVNLLNAIKLSGRTKEELGVGIFNAITEKTYAIVTDSVSGVTRDVLVEPLTNYNIVVLDQQFN
ncbi:MAG: carbohydrate binding family 9 domain-containing protein [Flavobacteriaceae bacterium]|nr:carbohydrate binding family 9 domain-containing protein [Flavobacteriaceae bacterium]